MIYKVKKGTFFAIAQQHLVGQRLLIIGASLTHSDTPHSVGHIWANYQLLLWQFTKLTGDRHTCPRGIRTHNASERAAANPRLRPRSHWNKQESYLVMHTFHEYVRIKFRYMYKMCENISRMRRNMLLQ